MKLTSQQLRNIILYETKKVLLVEEASSPKIEFPSWLEGKLKAVHGAPGQGSVFSNPDAIKDKVMQLLDKNASKIDSIANGSGTLTAKVPKIGYDLVISIDDAKKLPDAVESEVEKVEGQNKVTVPMVKTSAPITQFSTDQLTIVVRPKKDESGKILPNEYIVLSVFPGKDLPRASEWGGKYAIVIPSSKLEVGIKSESAARQDIILIERWQHLAGIIKD